MSGIQVFEFDPARLEGSFSNLQPVNDSVQRAESTTPSCCQRTRVTIGCRTFERGYLLELPLRGKKPNESPGDPAGNHQSHVMAAQIEPPCLQVLSQHEGEDVAEIIVGASGPPQCPPGVPSHLQLEGIQGTTQAIPVTAWTWKAPAVLGTAFIDALDEDLISLLHPFKMPDLPAQIWKLGLPRCRVTRMSATIAAFPDVRWQGKLNLSTRPKTAPETAFELLLDGDLACSYNGKQWPIREIFQAKSLCKWTDCLEMLARSATALMALRPGSHQSGLDNPRLTRMQEFRFEPWPRLSLTIEAGLFEQEGNGLLGHALRASLNGDPLVGASGEVGLIGPWLEEVDKMGLVAPLVAALDVLRAEEIAQEAGLFLVADGQISLRVGVEARRPAATTTAICRASGAVRVGVEARSIRDYDSFIIHQAGAEDAGRRPGFYAKCDPPVQTPQNDPREHKPRAGVEFTGLAVSRLEKQRPGCRFRRIVETGAKADIARQDNPAIHGSLLAPARRWPADAEPGETAEVPWCD